GLNGATGPTGATGPANLAALEGSPCTKDGAAGTLIVAVDAESGAVSLTCAVPCPSGPFATTTVGINGANGNWWYVVQTDSGYNNACRPTGTMHLFGGPGQPLHDSGIS